jgi:hypothetical protein
MIEHLPAPTRTYRRPDQVPLTVVVALPPFFLVATLVVVMTVLLLLVVPVGRVTTLDIPTEVPPGLLVAVVVGALGIGKEIEAVRADSAAAKSLDGRIVAILLKPMITSLSSRSRPWSPFGSYSEPTRERPFGFI